MVLGVEIVEDVLGTVSVDVSEKGVLNGDVDIGLIPEFFVASLGGDEEDFIRAGDDTVRDDLAEDGFAVALVLRGLGGEDDREIFVLLESVEEGLRSTEQGETHVHVTIFVADHASGVRVLVDLEHLDVGAHGDVVVTREVHRVRVVLDWLLGLGFDGVADCFREGLFVVVRDVHTDATIAEDGLDDFLTPELIVIKLEVGERTVGGEEPNESEKGCSNKKNFVSIRDHFVVVIVFFG